MFTDRARRVVVRLDVRALPTALCGEASSIGDDPRS